ncbi:MAG: class I SAM-dependent methyltransferase, partial [Myxococcota bacterium]
MNELTAERLVAINQTFYRRFAAAFDETRTGAWPGWHRLLQTERPRRVLDLGCGNGRFARFLSKRPAADRIAYEGWDDNPDLLARAQARAA